MIGLILIAAIQAGHDRLPEAEYVPVAWVQPPLIETPGRALERGQGGYAVLRCRFVAQRATNCVVLEESQAGMGFGGAALRGVSRAVAAPEVDGYRVIRLNFSVSSQ